jgi:hypothetical protein
VCARRRRISRKAINRPNTAPVPPPARRLRHDRARGTIIDTPHTFLYLVLGHGEALRYGIGVGRNGFTWSGTERIDGFRQRVVVPSDDGSMPWSDIQVLQDRLREADDALDRARAEAAQQKKKRRLRSQHVEGPTSATSYAVPIFGIARDFDVPLPNFSPLRRRTIHSRVHSNASISRRQRRVAGMS